VIFQPCIHVRAHVDLEAGHATQSGRYQPGPLGDATVNLADGHLILVARLAGQDMHHVPIAVASGCREADQDPLSPERLDQRTRPGRVVHQEQHVRDVRIGGQGGKKGQRLVLAHDDQRQVVGIIRGKRFDQRHMIRCPFIRLHVMEDDPVLPQVIQPAAARQQGYIVPGLVQASRKQAAQGARSAYEDLHCRFLSLRPFRLSLPMQEFPPEPLEQAHDRGHDVDGSLPEGRRQLRSGPGERRDFRLVRRAPGPAGSFA